MSPNFKPLLAVPVEDYDKLKYPLYASFKFDGIRCYCAEMVPPPGDSCVPVTRSLKILPNMYTRDKLSKLPPGFDGELMCGTKFQDCQKGFMTRSGTPDFKYHVFDYVPNDQWSREPYWQRLAKLWDEVAQLREEFPWLVFVKQETVNNPEGIEELEEIAIESEHEGLILRSSSGHYKYGRSTFNEHLLLKVKQFEDREAAIVDCVPRFRNNNAPIINALGYQERSSHKENMVQDEALGSLVVEDEKFPGHQFQIGSGFTEEDRIQLWKYRGSVLKKGRLVKYKYQPHGTKDVPRTPIFIGFRDEEDLS